jgi:hypothetical protein
MRNMERFSLYIALTLNMLAPLVLPWYIISVSNLLVLLALAGFWRQK